TTVFLWQLWCRPRPIVSPYTTLFRSAAKNFAIGNIAITAADHRRNSLDCKTQIGAGAFDFDAIRLFHQPLERFHAGLQLAIIESSEEHTSELQSPDHLVCRRLLEKQK